MIVAAKLHHDKLRQDAPPLLLTAASSNDASGAAVSGEDVVLHDQDVFETNLFASHGSSEGEGSALLMSEEKLAEQQVGFLSLWTQIA